MLRNMFVVFQHVCNVIVGISIFVVVSMVIPDGKFMPRLLTGLIVMVGSWGFLFSSVVTNEMFGLLIVGKNSPIFYYTNSFSSSGAFFTYGKLSTSFSMSSYLSLTVGTLNEISFES